MTTENLAGDTPAAASDEVHKTLINRIRAAHSRAQAARDSSTTAITLRAYKSEERFSLAGGSCTLTTTLLPVGDRFHAITHVRTTDVFTDTSAAERFMAVLTDTFGREAIETYAGARFFMVQAQPEKGTVQVHS